MEKICWQVTITTWVLPLQYDLRCPAAKDHSLMRAAAAARNLDAATAARENTMFHTPASSPNTRPMQHSRRHYNVFCSIMCALMQPLQCDLQPHFAEHHHGGTNHVKTNGPQPPHTRLQPLYRKKQSFVLRRPPQHKSHATFLQPFCTTSLSCHTFLSHCLPNSSHFSKSSLPKVSTSLLTASLGHHFPWSPLP